MDQGSDFESLQAKRVKVEGGEKPEEKIKSETETQEQNDQDTKIDTSKNTPKVETLAKDPENKSPGNRELESNSGSKNAENNDLGNLENVENLENKQENITSEKSSGHEIHGNGSRTVLVAEKVNSKDLEVFISEMVSGGAERVDIESMAKGIEGARDVRIIFEENERFEEQMEKVKRMITSETVCTIEKIGVYVDFRHHVDESKKTAFSRFSTHLHQVAGSKVVQWTVLRKYDGNTAFITEKDDLAQLGAEIQADVGPWGHLQVLDYGFNKLRVLPGVRFPEKLRVLNLGGTNSIETLAGFKLPSELHSLDVSHGHISSIDYLPFPSSLRHLNLSYNHIYFLHYAEFPSNLLLLDLSHNRIDSLKNIVFPGSLRHLALGNNPIECIKGARFPDGIVHLDLSCMPNESMTGVKFPDNCISLDLQQSMSTTRGLKLPPALRHLNLAATGVNSINPLRLPDSLDSLFLSHNNIKTLNKVVFPPCLRELYLGNNLLTTLKNVSFPPTLHVLDLDMDPHADDNEKFLTSLKDVLFPPSLKVLKLAYHLIRALEGLDFPFYLEHLHLQYNDLKVFRNIRFGPHLRYLDLSGNNELFSLDSVIFPDLLTEIRVPSSLLNGLPANLVDRVNAGTVRILKSA